MLTDLREQTLRIYITRVLQASFLTLGLVSQVAGQQGTNPLSQATICVRLLNGPAITVDQVTGEAFAELNIRNQTDKPQSVALVAAVTSPINSPVYGTFASNSQPQPTRIYQSVLAPKASGSVNLIIHEAWDDSEFDVELFNHFGAEQMGKVHVRRFPVGIKIDGADQLKLALVDGETTRIALRNDDPVRYPVLFSVMNGEKLCAGEGTLVPKSLGILECTTNLIPKPSRFVNLIKSDKLHDGLRLVLTPQKAATSSVDRVLQPIKTFPVAASVDYFGLLTRSISSYFIVFALLMLGGISSLVLSYTLPNKLKRLDLKAKLRDLTARTSDLSTRIESRLTVLVRLERSRLRDLLYSRAIFSPDFSTIATQVTTGIAALNAKVAVLEQMDVVLGRLSQKLAQGAPPTQIDAINSALQDASVLLSKNQVSDSDVQSANTAVFTASTGVDNLNQPNDQFGKLLADEIHEFLSDTDRLAIPSGTYLSLIQRLPGPNTALRTLQPTDQLVAPDKYVELDFALQKSRILRSYVSLKDGTTDPEMTSRLDKRLDQLIALLQLESWDSLSSARLLLREMQDDIYPERLIEIIQAADTFIEMDPSTAYEQSPLEFCACFHKSALNNSAAREEIQVEWDFGDGLKGKGWTVYHYFQLKRKRDTFNVSACFHDPSGQILTDQDGERIATSFSVKVNPSEFGRGVGERTRTELLKLGVALLIALFGLMSGAQDQISKLDLLPGLVAVFLVGFSADSVKRILTAN